MLKKIIIFILILVNISLFSVTTTELDNYWLEYIGATRSTIIILTTVLDSTHFESCKLRLAEAFKFLAAKAGQYQPYSELLRNRYMYHIRNRTEIGRGLLDSSYAFVNQLRRISTQVSGGKEFIQSIFLNQQVAEQLYQQNNR